jgi:hypothetical protein
MKPEGYKFFSIFSLESIFCKCAPCLRIVGHDHYLFVVFLCFSDMERKQKVKQIFGSAAIQQGELRKLKRKKQ